MARQGRQFPASRHRQAGNLAAPTLINAFYDTEKAVFGIENPTVVDTIGRKPVKSRSGFLFRPARLVAPPDEDLSKPWYIVFYTTTAEKQYVDPKARIEGRAL